MADRYFENFMSNFVEKKLTVSGAEAEKEEEEEDSVLKLLSLPYPILSEKLKRAALDLKETIVVETWELPGRNVQDFSLYRGALGTAFLLFKSYQVTDNINDLNLSSEIIKACDSASSNSSAVTFVLGRAGVCALGAVVAKQQGDTQMLGYYLTQFKEIKVNEDLPDEMLFGRVGFLWACLFLNKNLGDGTVPSTNTSAVVEKIIKNGRKLGVRSRCPLMYDFHHERIWGVAHGLAGITYVLMNFELNPDEFTDVKMSLKYMIKNRCPSGNYPRDEDKRDDFLVQWCHGAPGIALTLVKAAEVFEDKEFLEAATNAAEVVWHRGLLKNVGICHGISGNAYVFLSLYRLTGKMEFLHRAKAFACFLLDKAGELISRGEMHGGDSPYSLFEGVGGMAYLFLDMTDPANARFPGHEL